MNYQKKLLNFISEISTLNIPEFSGFEKWQLFTDLQNGVRTNIFEISQTNRLILHNIGMKHSIIPLCVNEVVELDFKEDHSIKFAVVETNFGRLPIIMDKI